MLMTLLRWPSGRKWGGLEPITPDAAARARFYQDTLA